MGDGMLSLLFNPIVPTLPIIGGLKLFFLNPPAVKLEFVGLAQLVNFPMLQKVVDGAIQEAIAASLVLPNVLSINWMPEKATTGDPAVAMSSQFPTGVLRIAVLDAQGFIVNQRLCCVMKFGAARYRTDKCKKPSPPTWEEIHDFLIYDSQQLLSLEVWSDKNMLAKSEHLEMRRLLVRKGVQLFKLIPVKGVNARVQQSVAASTSGPGKSSGASVECFIRIEVSKFDLMAEFSILGRFPETGKSGLSMKGGSMKNSGSEVSTNSSASSLDARRNQTSFLPLSLARSAPGPLMLPCAVLVCTIIKGRVPPDHVQGSMLGLAVYPGGDEANPRRILPSDITWQATLGLDDNAISTIRTLAREGLSSEKIAVVLNMPEALVSKVMAHSLGFNVEVPQRLEVLVQLDALNCGDIQLEFRRRGRCEAATRIPLQNVVTAPGQKLLLRRMVALQPTANSRMRWGAQQVGLAAEVAASTEASERFDFDVEFNLMGYVPPGFLLSSPLSTAAAAAAAGQPPAASLGPVMSATSAAPSSQLVSAIPPVAPSASPAAQEDSRCSVGETSVTL